MIDPALLPEAVVGTVSTTTPIHMGLSGASVHAVNGSRGEFILRVQGNRFDESFWHQHVAVLRRASEHGIAPELVYVDESAHAMISRRVAGVPLPAVLGDPAARRRALDSTIEQLRRLHALDTAGVNQRDAVQFVRGVWESQRNRPGFPTWAMSAGDTIDGYAAILSRDSRRVLSHNDVNPGNVMWDGTRAWLIDWEVAGISHPYFDAAALATFLNMDRAAGLELLSLQEQATIDDASANAFDATRRLIATMSGLIGLSAAPDLSTVMKARTRDETPTLGDVYAGMRAGTLSLQTPEGHMRFALALLRAGTETERS